jgi:hypothetical protein
MTECNGWTNFPTMSIISSILNDDVQFSYFVDLASRFTTKELATELKESFEDYVSFPSDPLSARQNLYTWALEQVNWIEVAERIKTEV